MNWFLALLLPVTFCLSWLNARALGRSWSDSRVIEGWVGILVTASMFMSSAAFTWCYFTLVAILAWLVSLAPHLCLDFLVPCKWFAVLLPIVGIFLSLWMNYYSATERRRNIQMVGFAAWETYDKYHAMTDEIQFMPEFFNHLDSTINGKSDKKGIRGQVAAAFIKLAATLMFSGFLTTTAIIKDSAKKYARHVAGDIRGVGL